MLFCKKNIYISNVINTFFLTSADCWDTEDVQAEEVVRQRCMVSDECGERTKQNAGHELEVQTEDLQSKMSQNFDINQEETGFSLLK